LNKYAVGLFCAEGPGEAGMYALVVDTEEKIHELVHAADGIPDSLWPVEWWCGTNDHLFFDNLDDYRSCWTIKPVSGGTAVEMMIILGVSHPSSWGKYPTPEFFKDYLCDANDVEARW
jgi:hypothetical protein